MGTLKKRRKKRKGQSRRRRNMTTKRKKKRRKRKKRVRKDQVQALKFKQSNTLSLTKHITFKLSMNLITEMKLAI